MTTNSTLSKQLREMATNGATLLELIELVHTVEGVPTYNRGLILHHFPGAFALKATDFTTIIFACEIFGDGATMPLDEAEQLFKERLPELLLQ